MMLEEMRSQTGDGETLATTDRRHLPLYRLWALMEESAEGGRTRHREH